MHKLRYNLHKNNNCTGSTYLKDKKKKDKSIWHKDSPLLFLRNEISVKKCMEYSFENTRDVYIQTFKKICIVILYYAVRTCKV